MCAERLSPSLSTTTPLTLASRSGRVARDGQGLASQLHGLGARAEVVACDSADPSDTCALIGRCGKLVGVLHAAGTLRDRMARQMSSSDVELVFGPKAVAASLLHHATTRAPLATLLFFSSVASTFGNVGQANYAAANAYLDALARGRRAHGLAARSAQLPLVGGAGMGAAAFGGRQQRYRGMAAIALDEYAASVRVLLARPEAGGRKG
mgnify:CR=1 FL=1